MNKIKTISQLSLTLSLSLSLYIYMEKVTVHKEGTCLYACIYLYIKSACTKRVKMNLASDIQGTWFSSININIGKLNKYNCLCRYMHFLLIRKEKTF
jgi:hypothetical protein